MKHPHLKLAVIHNRIQLTVWEKARGGYNIAHTVSLSKQEATNLVNHVNRLIVQLNKVEE